LLEFAVKQSLVLSARYLSKTYRAGLNGCTASARALEDVHLDIAQGEVVAIVGPANAGKTTLLRCLAGLLAPDRGRIEPIVPDIVTYVQSPIELTRLRAQGESRSLTIIDNVDVVERDVGSAFALATAARSIRASGRAMLLAARDSRLVANLATRILMLERGRFTRTTTVAVAGSARVAETSTRP
jgi:ABC-type multidrug transport system ATPase subunit